jgi:hypothetical protein
MVDFRKLLLALIAGALMLTSVASANYGCTATAVTPFVRWEGRAELVGEVRLNCEGDVVGTDRITVNIRMKLNTNVTSNVVGNLGGSTATPNTSGLAITDSVLLLDGGANGWRGYDSAANLDPSYKGDQNVFQAVRITDTEIEWQNVTLYGGAGTNPTRNLRITNVRGNASAFSATGGQIRAYVNITTPSTVSVTNNDVAVADVRQGVYLTTTSASLKRCELSGEGDSDFSLLFHEGGPISGGLANSFKWKGPDAGNANRMLDVSYYNESGFEPILVSGAMHLEGSTLPVIGRADQGTELRAVLTGIPAGVSLTFPLNAPLTVPDYGLRAVLQGTGTTRTPDSGGKITVIYRITESPAASVGNIETVTIPVGVTFDTADFDTRLIGTVRAAGSFNPISSIIVMSGPEKEPRFRDSSTDAPQPFTVLDIGACRTILLFPYLTNSPGFDTGLAISNTSVDPIHTQAQDGACTLNFYGLANGHALTAAQATQVTPTIPGGGQLIMLLSSNVGSVVDILAPTTVATCTAGNCVLPAFQGYMFATCNFQYAHGFAFISDLGASKLAMGYLALIVPDRGDKNRLPQNAAITDDEDGGANQGEQLGL